MRATTCPTKYFPTECKPVKKTRKVDCFVSEAICQPGEVCFECGANPWAIIICNSNAVKDDSWDIFLNNTFVANYNIGNEQRALIILPQSTSGKTLHGHTGRGCSLFSYVYSPLLDSLSGIIELKMTIVAINGAGNFGTLEYACVTQDATDATIGATLNSTNYSGSGLGYTLTKQLNKQ